MANPTGALYAEPTQFARSLNGIDSTWGRDITNNSAPFAGGLGNPMRDAIPGIGGTSSYNAARGPALGAYDQTNFAVMLDGEAFRDHRSSSKQINLVSRNKGLGQDTMGLSSWNQKARYDPDWVQTYGGGPDDKSPRAILDAWSLYGSPIGNTPEELLDVGEKTLGYHIGKRARIWNLGLCISGDHVIVGDHLYVMLRRYKEVDELANVFSGSLHGVKPAATKADQYYWQHDPYLSHDRMPPPSHLYTNSISNGVCFLIGTVSALYGAPGCDSESIQAARDALHPKEDNAAYLYNLKSGFEIDVMLGCAM